jgi:hypothetical protein
LNGEKKGISIFSEKPEILSKQVLILRKTKTTTMNLLLFLLLLSNFILPNSEDPQKERPNILFLIADDWSYPHAGVYGDPMVLTPTFDKLAQEGALF